MLPLFRALYKFITIVVSFHLRLSASLPGGLGICGGLETSEEINKLGGWGVEKTVKSKTIILL